MLAPKHLSELVERFSAAGYLTQILMTTEKGDARDFAATSDDPRRVEFIRRALQGVENCLNDGIPVKGYCHWSLMDNFEWQKGYSMTFGLIAVHRTTQERKPKESLKYLGSFAQ